MSVSTRLSQYALALDGHERRRGLKRRLHQDARRLAGRVPRFFGDEVDAVVVGALPGHVAAAGGVEQGGGADGVAAHVRRRGANYVLTSGLDGQRDARHAPRTGHDRLHADGFFGLIATPPQAAVGTDLADRVPLLPDQFDAHGPAADWRAAGIDGYHVHLHLSAALQIEVGGLRTQADVELRGVERERSQARLLLPRGVGDGGRPLEAHRLAVGVAAQADASAQTAVSVEDGRAFCEALRDVGRVERAEAEGLEAAGCEAVRGLLERVGHRLPGHRGAEEVAPLDRALEEVTGDISGRGGIGRDDERGAPESVDAERGAGPGRRAPLVRRRSVGRGRDAQTIVALVGRSGRGPVEVERAPVGGQHAAVEHDVVARRPHDDAGAVACGAPVAVGARAQDALEVDRFASLVEPAVAEDGARYSARLGVPVGVHLEAIRLRPAVVERGREREVAASLDDHD